MALVDWLSAAIGAFISGIIGIIAVWYRMIREDRRNLKHWYTTSRRLAQRVDRANQEPPWDSDQALYFRNTCAGVHTKMAEHVSQAPSGVDEAFLDHAEEFISYCQKVVSVPESRAKSQPDELIDASQDAVTKAGVIAKLALNEFEDGDQ